MGQLSYAFVRNCFMNEDITSGMKIYWAVIDMLFEILWRLICVWGINQIHQRGS